MHMDTISDENLKTISLFTILVAVFGLIATTTSKTSVALTLYRIVLDRWIKWALIFIIISSNITMNLIWVFGFAKCTPLEKVWDPSVPGTCWDKQKLLKYQLFASCKCLALDTPHGLGELTIVCCRLLCRPRLSPRPTSVEDHHGHDDASARKDWCRNCHESGRSVRSLPLLRTTPRSSSSVY